MRGHLSIFPRRARDGTSVSSTISNTRLRKQDGTQQTVTLYRHHFPQQAHLHLRDLLQV